MIPAAITVIPFETPTLGDRSYLVHDGEVLRIEPRMRGSAADGAAWLRGLFGRARRSTMLAGGVLTWKDSR